MSQWSVEEMKKLAGMRQAVKNAISNRRQIPDVVGDRRLLRFLRGHGTVEKASQMYLKFLKWRDDNDVDSIRDDILYGGMTSMYDIPHARKIFRLLPQTMMSADALDNSGNPIALESFNFQPEVILKEVPKPDYVTFMIYTLEYKILMLDQLAYQREKVFIEKQTERSKQITAPYGVMVQSNIIRDLSGFGMANVGTDGQTVMKWILEIAADNYPELLYKSHMINAPWIFNSIWWIVKNIMDPNTIKKISITGTDYMKVLLKDMPITSIPNTIGGNFIPSEQLFKFDISPETSPFYYPGCENEINFEARKAARIAINNNNSSSIRKVSTVDLPLVQENRLTSTTNGRNNNGKSMLPSPYSMQRLNNRNGYISTASTESILLDALANRKVKVSYILKMGDPTRAVESFVAGRTQRMKSRQQGYSNGKGGDISANTDNSKSLIRYGDNYRVRDNRRVTQNELGHMPEQKQCATCIIH